jgi:periplasmic protein TonB
MKKITFIIFCLSMQFALFGQNSTDSVKKIIISSESKDDGNAYSVVEDMPEFPGGEEARIKFLSKNLKYPEKAREKSIEGTVYVQFVVEKDGSLTNIKVKRGIGGGCDEECLRVVKLMPKWKPGKQNGKEVRVQYMLPIKFILH